jgi:hypothetical protein
MSCLELTLPKTPPHGDADIQPCVAAPGYESTLQHQKCYGEAFCQRLILKAKLFVS